MSKIPTPLAHKTAMIACSEQKAGTLAAGLEALGAEVIVFPVIRIQEIADKSGLDAAIDRLDGYSWIIFTSVYGVHFFVKRMEERGTSKDRCCKLKICAVGPATAAALEISGLKVSLVPRDHVAAGILAALAEEVGGNQNLDGLRILIPRAREARELLPAALEKAGAFVNVVPCYENTAPALDRDFVRYLLRRAPELLLFTSSSAVDHFVTLVGSQEAKNLLTGATLAALGPIAASTLATYGKQAEIVPHENTIPSLLSAIRTYYLSSERLGPAVRNQEPE
jgi:uroporphyrinogen III methyltransferase/synthase